jgi:hypothetical protein
MALVAPAQIEDPPVNAATGAAGAEAQGKGGVQVYVNPLVGVIPGAKFIVAVAAVPAVEAVQLVVDVRLL